MSYPFAKAGSQKWLQVAIAKAPEILNEALWRSGAIESDDSVHWKAPLASENFREYRDGKALRCLGVKHLSKRPLSKFWPHRGPVWDALGQTRKGRIVLVEAKAHIPEAASPPSRATETSLALIRRALDEAKRYYAPRSHADWSSTLYQYANRLAFQYLFAHLNGLPSSLVFVNFINATDVGGPESEAEWQGATSLIHALLGLPADLTKHRVFHAYVDVRLICKTL
jgi:hypothetical protein